MASADSKVVFVTGANQGLGLAIIEVAGLRYPDNVYILGSRDVGKGEEGVQQLREKGVKARVDVVQLEVDNDEHITAAVDYVAKAYGRLNVPVNNAGMLRGVGVREDDPAAIRATYASLFDVHVTSVAVLTLIFKPLLYRARAAARRMFRVPPYGASKVALNGLTAHLQVDENDRAADDAAHPEAPSLGPRIRFFISNPGVLATSFSGFHPRGKAPQLGAESAVRLIGDAEGEYDDYIQWEFEGGEMRKVLW
ncbi:short chain dehydrogenase/reductase family protein [Lasiosphaeria miniovina]|uniref:Short chain dehydrogenase/reductase family protein n=1 Tax=Lasiosphaeria miniovina TaxID=1954250 RepID=A0AA40DVW8_9PEZI|nr:short chain dehydrogenase/reductase family protein [Lasiosphaeria miniovina]KAK0717575.1 short chain dehydrogenase/reductase family protein [Lasiosphaeria miniovina]